VTDSETDVQNVHPHLSHKLINDIIIDARSRLDLSVRSRCFRSSRSLIRCWHTFSCSMLHTWYSTRIKSGEFGGQRSGGTKSGVVYPGSRSGRSSDSSLALFVSLCESWWWTLQTSLLSQYCPCRLVMMLRMCQLTLQ